MWEDSFDRMRNFQRKMNRIFDTMLESPEFEKYTGTRFFRQPLSDIKETENEIIASVELPGIDKEDIQLTAIENNLTIKVDKKTEKREQEENYIRSERSRTGFYRSMTLPSKIKPEKIKAKYKNGILTIKIPKKEKKSKKIKIE